MAIIAPWLQFNPLDVIKFAQMGGQLGVQRSEIATNAGTAANQLQLGYAQLAQRAAEAHQQSANQSASIAANREETNAAQKLKESQITTGNDQWKQQFDATNANVNFDNALNAQKTSVGAWKALNPPDPSQVRIADEILSTESAAKRLEDAGNSAGATQLRDRATLLREQMKGQEVVTGYDDQGRPIIRMGKGVGAPTVATQSQAQQKLLRYENTIQLLNHLDNNLKPEHLGVMGLGGEWLMDRGVAQLFPEVANKDRVDARSTLVAAREGLMKEISNDPRFSNMDREEISKALPSSGAFESYPDAKQKLDTVRKVILDRTRTYSKGIGQPIPIWAMSAEEITNSYKAGQIDKQSALDALVKFH